jgi:hypothetical protein
MSTQHHNEYFYGYILLGDIVLSSLRQTWLDKEQLKPHEDMIRASQEELISTRENHVWLERSHVCFERSSNDLWRVFL